MPNQPKPDSHRHEVYVSDDLWARAKQTAAARGESVSAVVRRALEDYVRSAK